MAKRVGNVANVEDIRERGISPAAVRHFMFNVHYRKQLNLTDEALEASIVAVRRIGEFAARLAAARGWNAGDGEGGGGARTGCERGALRGLECARGAGRAVQVPQPGERGAGCRRDATRRGLERARAAFAKVNGVLDIVPEAARVDSELAAWVEDRFSGPDGGAGGARFRDRGRGAEGAGRARDRDRGHASGDTVEEAAVARDRALRGLDGCAAFV